MKKVVAYVIPSLEIGGSESKVVELAQGLDKTKYEPIIITISKMGPLLEKAKNSNIRVFSVNKKGKFDLFVVNRIARLLKEHKVDIVQVFTSTGKLWGRLAAFKAKIKVVISTEESLFRNKPMDRFLERRLAKKTSVIITNSNASKASAIKGTGIHESKYVVIHNGIELTRFYEGVSHNVLRSGNEQVLMTIARFDPRKKLDLLINAFSIVVKTHDAKLVLVGSGPLEESLKKQVNDLNLQDKVLFLGYRKDTPDLLKEADVFLLTSSEEGFGNVIIEAMASKVPVVASGVGGIKEIIKHNHNGLLFESGNQTELVRLIKNLLDSKDTRDKLSTNAFNEVEQYSLSRMIKDHETLYQKLS